MSAGLRKPAKRHHPAPGGYARTFAALGDETRLALLARLYSGAPRSITELSDGIAVTRQAVTKHLRALEGAGLVRCRREGRESLFTFVPRPVNELQEYLTAVALQWDSALDRLKAFAETDA